MPQFVEQEPPSGSPTRKVSERAAATCVRFRPAARLSGCAKETATVGRADASRSSCARRKWSGAIRKKAEDDARWSKLWTDYHTGISNNDAWM